RPIALAWDTPQPPPLTTFMKVKEDRPDYFFNAEYADTWRPALAEMFEARLRAQIDGARPDWREPATRVVIKEPGGSQMASELLALGEGSRLVFLLRDGRDVVDSWLDAYGEGTWASEDGAYVVTEENRIPFIRWQAAVWKYRTEALDAAYEAHDPERRTLIRYEELLAAPEAVMSALLDDLGLDPDPALVAAIVAAEAHASVPDEEKGSGKEIRLARPGSWRESMGDEEVAAMEAEIGDSLRAHGY
ncbi:MAG: sulfotransferase, partial [Acidobacteria bacterium]|nr:sulfotransferase [Acidobacteriota bacterium]